MAELVRLRRVFPDPTGERSRVDDGTIVAAWVVCPVGEGLGEAMESYILSVIWVALAQLSPFASPIDQGWNQSLPGFTEARSFTTAIAVSAPVMSSARSTTPAQKTGNPTDRSTDMLGTAILSEGASAQPIRWWHETQPLGTYAIADPLLTNIPQVVAVPAPNAFSWGLAGLGLLLFGRMVTANRRRARRVY